jgi:hypothetical protein
LAGRAIDASDYPLGRSPLTGGYFVLIERRATFCLVELPMRVGIARAANPYAQPLCLQRSAQELLSVALT